MTKDVVLCTDGSTALAGAACQLGVEHHAVNLSAGIRVDGAWHVQNVNAYHSRLKGWIYKFRGVATLLPGKLPGWFRALDRDTETARNPLSGSLWRLAWRLNNIIYEKSLVQYSKHCALPLDAL